MSLWCSQNQGVQYQRAAEHRVKRRGLPLAVQDRPGCAKKKKDTSTLVENKDDGAIVFQARDPASCVRSTPCRVLTCAEHVSRNFSRVARGRYGRLDCSSIGISTYIRTLHILYDVLRITLNFELLFEILRTKIAVGYSSKATCIIIHSLQRVPVATCPLFRHC